jgi:hypothetical protein
MDMGVVVKGRLKEKGKGREKGRGDEGSFYR